VSAFAPKGTKTGPKQPGIIHNISSVQSCQLCDGKHTAKECPTLNPSGRGPLRRNFPNSAERAAARKEKDCYAWMMQGCKFEELKGRPCGYKHDPAKKGTRQLQTETDKAVNNLVNVVENLTKKINNNQDKNQTAPGTDITKLQNIQKILSANAVTTTNQHQSGDVALTQQPFLPKLFMVNSQYSFKPMPTISEEKSKQETWSEVISKSQKKQKKQGTFKGIRPAAVSVLSNFSLSTPEDDGDSIFDSGASTGCAGTSHKHVKNIRPCEPVSMQVASGQISTSKMKGDIEVSEELTHEVKLFDNFRMGIIALGEIVRKGYVFAGDDERLVIVRKSDGKKVGEGFLREDNLYHTKN
jgi:hypothetical protein